jgi:sugar/nucleoside kinase (ribokinase family)
MNFGVIGEPCIDYIHKPGQDTIKSFGGILYSAVSLAVIAGKEHGIYPVFYVGSDEYDNIISFLLNFGNIRTDFIVKCPQPTRVVDLHYDSYLLTSSEYAGDEHAGGEKRSDRQEFWTEPLPPVEFSHIEKVLPGLDALLLNMISGVDITLETLSNIKRNFGNYTHIDVHNVVIRREPEGRTIRQSHNNWEQWCTQCDTVQMNEPEINVMTGQNLSEYEIAERILTLGEIHGVKSLVVTRGRSGVSLYQKKEKHVMNEKYTEIDKTDVPAAERVNFRDSTGCGDVFASAFFYKNAVNKCSDFLKAFKFANRIAGMKTESVGVEELHKLSA